MKSQIGRSKIYSKSEWDGPYGIQKCVTKPTINKLVTFYPDLFAIELNKSIVELKGCWLIK